MNLSILDCSFKNGSTFTVGEVKELICSGKIPLSISTPLKIEFLDTISPYALKILKTTFISKDQIILQVTGYQTGQYSQVNFQIINKEHSLHVRDISWSIQSVLDKQEAKSMIPPYGPWLTSYPHIYFWSLGFGCILLLGVFLSWLRKLYKKKEIKQRVLDRLQEKTPIQYFIQQTGEFMVDHKEWSSFEKKFNQLYQIFREFLENQLYIDIECSIKKMIQQLNNSNLLNKEFKTQGVKIALELDKIKVNLSGYSKKDGEKLLEIIRQWVFSIHKESEL